MIQRLSLKYGILRDKVSSCMEVVVVIMLRLERYRSLAPMYYRGAAAAIVVFDITKKVYSQLSGVSAY